MRRAAPANWSNLPNRNRPRFYTAWTQSEHRRAGDVRSACTAGRQQCDQPRHLLSSASTSRCNGDPTGQGALGSWLFIVSRLRIWTAYAPPEAGP